MNLSLLQAFQTAVNEHGLGDDNARVRMHRREDKQSCYARVVHTHTPSGDSNKEVRSAFKLALTSAFGVERFDELPAEVKKVLKIGDFKLSKDGEVDSSRPLTMRRIKAVMNAVKDVTVSAARDGNEARQVENAFTSGFRDCDAIEKMFERISIVSGRAPMKFTLPNGMELSVPLSDLAQYTKGIPREDLAASIDDLQGQVQRDIDLGCSIYENLMAGNDCISTDETHRALRYYLSFMALASGTAGKSRVISLPDPSGKVADFLKLLNPDSVRRLWANDSVTGASGRVIFVSDMESLGAASAPMRQRDLEMRYAKLVSNPMASELLRREARQGGLTVAQMLANIKAELARLATVGDEELTLEVSKERGKDRADPTPAEIGATKAFESFYSFRYALSDFIGYLQCFRLDLTHPEMRIGDEIVLTKEFLGKYSKAENDNQVVSPRNARRQTFAPSGRERQTVSAPASLGASAVPSSPASPDAEKLEWIHKEIAQCGNGDLRRGVASVVKCLRTGCSPQGKPPPPQFDSKQMRGNEIPSAILTYLNSLDKEFIADLAWYVKSSSHLADDTALSLFGETPRRNIPRPMWTALRRGLIDRDFPPEICKEMANLFKADDLSKPFSVRVGIRPLRAGEKEPVGGSLIDRAAVSTWGFGTYDMERILKFIKDCGWNVDEMTPGDIGKLTAIAALSDYRLEDAPTFFQRQTGKSPVEVATKDLERLFRLKCAARLNDAGAKLSGASREIVDILKGDKLPSMTRATGDEALRLLAELRSLLDAGPNSARIAEFLGRKFSIRVTLSGTLVFNVDGLEFRAAKTPREFVEVIEDDIVGNVAKFGLTAVYRTLPQIRGAEVSSNPVDKSRSRELCLRYLKSAAGVDPSFFASVGTREIFRVAEGVADGRYRLRSGEISQNAVRSMLERTIDRNAMTSKDAAELCAGIEGKLDVAGVDITPMSSRPQALRVPMKEDVKKVHEFLADLLFDSNPFEFDKARQGNAEMRVLEIMRRHIPALVAIAKDPEIVTTFPEDIIGDIGDLIGIGLQFLPMRYVRSISDEEIARTLNFLVDAMYLPAKDRPAAVDGFLRKGKSEAKVDARAAKTSSGKGVLGTIAGFVSGIFKPGMPESSKAPSLMADIIPDFVKREFILDAIDKMAEGIADADMNIEAGVNVAMRRIQNVITAKMGMMTSDGTVDAPMWSMEFEEIVGGAMSDSGSGYGMFMNKVLSSYFTASAMVDQRRMLSSLVRYTQDGMSAGMMAGALFKGAGPLLQKMLQGLPPSALGDDLACALEDMKSNLLPIPNEYVVASMRRIVERSAGRILSVRVERSLGAASVGQAFLCKMFTKEHPEGEECVVKLLRPTVKTAIIREREIFEAAAASVPGMAKTFEGQLSRILDELDFTLEATNINFGRSVYEQPVYLCQNSPFSNSEILTFNLTSLHSMEVHPLVTPTMDCLVLKKAPGETYDSYLKEQDRRIGELLRDVPVRNGKYVFPTHAAAACHRKTLCEIYNETLKRQRYLIDLTMKWVHEGLFGNGFYHGDLHAGNIMTDGNGLTVIDFGNATHLTPIERGHVLRMISAALVGWSDMFEDSFRSLLSVEGKAQYDAANAEGKVSCDLAEVLNKGTSMDIAMRIAAALMLLQKHGIEVPGAIYNFNQCQMRLGGTVDAMNRLLERISAELSRLSAPEFRYDAPEGDFVSAQMFSAVSGLTMAFAGYFANPFEPDSIAKSREWLQEIVADFNSSIHKPGGMHLAFMDELKDEEHCRKNVYAFIKLLQTVKPLISIVDPGVKDSRLNLAEVFSAYMKKSERTDGDREKLVAKVFEAVKELHNIAMVMQDLNLIGKPTSFLEAVGSAISGSLYTVRTTLGNITSMKLKKEQEAEAVRIEQAKERMQLSDQRVAAYLGTRRHESELSKEAVLVIKDIASKLSFPFDMPGLNGSKAWIDSYSANCKIFEVFLLNVKKLLDELERRQVFNEDTTVETKKEATCVAMQYLVDRSGGLFEAFGDIENHVRMRLMALLSEFLRSQAALRIGGASDADRSECVMAAMLYLFMGGVQPLPAE